MSTFQILVLCLIALLSFETRILVSGLVLSDHVKDVLASKLNDIVDLPVLGEAQEQRIAETLIDRCMDPFEETINETSPEEVLGVLSEMIVTKMNHRVDIPFASEEQEAKIMGLIVTYFLRERFGDIAQMIEDCPAEE